LEVGKLQAGYRLPFFSAQGKTSPVAQFRLEQKRTKKQQITFFKNGIPHYTCIIHREPKNPLLTVGHNVI